MDILKEIAKELDGMNHPKNEPKKETIEKAIKNDVVIVYGYSDDLVEIRGAVDDEFEAWEGTTLYIKDGKITDLNCECGKECGCCENTKINKEMLPKIKALYCEEKNYCWTFDTEIPHETFNILDKQLDEDEIYCRGIVFSIKPFR